eukprot:SAG31_NODE_7217_length_1752_cov_12.118572_1_plen_60_part_10
MIQINNVALLFTRGPRLTHLALANLAYQLCNGDATWLFLDDRATRSNIVYLLVLKFHLVR